MWQFLCLNGFINYACGIWVPYLQCASGSFIMTCEKSNLYPLEKILMQKIFHSKKVLTLSYISAEYVHCLHDEYHLLMPASDRNITLKWPHYFPMNSK